MANKGPGPMTAPGGAGRWSFHHGSKFLATIPEDGGPVTLLPAIHLHPQVPRPAIDGEGGSSGPPAVTRDQLYPRPDSIGT